MVSTPSRSAVIAAISMLIPGALLAASPAKSPSPAQEKAYTLSLMCSVVAGYYENEADILRTADAMRKMGAAMGYDNKRIANDVTTMASALGVELRNDPKSMERHRASCRQIGLVS